MTEPAGLQGPLQSVFEDGLRLLAAALAIRGGPERSKAAVTSACSAIRCFLKIIQAGTGLPDPGGDLVRLKAQCEALLSLGQAPEDALVHALEAARLARDAAARILVLLPQAHREDPDA
ncbi:MAG: hypothetical protein P4L36_00790 [Holophaga sp.]|nr:hypothetical protein [Holophaga sp.]